MWLEYVGYIFLSVIKFLFAPMIMIGRGFGFIETVITVMVGATIGLFIFYYLGRSLFHWWSKKAINKGKKVFSPKRRRLIRFKNKYGLRGLMIVSGIISVPISSLLAAKYFDHKKGVVLWMWIGFLLWTCLVTTLSFLFKILIGYS